jgi:hypothetical protein
MLRYTRQGQIGSEAYNRNIQCATIRYGMIDMIRHPPIGFEDVITRHFALCRQRIVLQCKRWMHEMASTSYSSRFFDNNGHLTVAQFLERWTAHDGTIR